MSLSLDFFREITSLPLRVWVLAPHVVHNDEQLDYYYDFSQSIEEYNRVFAALDLPWIWQPVTLDDYPEVIRKIQQERDAQLCYPVILNLCDGDEMNGAPGISVLKELERRQLLFTGSDAHFYRITTSKLPMKRAFEAHSVATPAWREIRQPGADLSALFHELGCPLIVKPAVSGGSMGIGVKNVVHTEEELQAQVAAMFSGYRNWNLTVDGLLAESFIKGREFTVLLVGSYTHPESIRVYRPVERIFHPSLPAEQRFLSFDRLWEIYEDETPMPEAANFYDYAAAPPALVPELEAISREAYLATGGTGYTRADIRMDEQGNLFVLEVNAQCGLSEDEDFTSIGAILRYSGISFTELIVDIFRDACRRWKQKYPGNLPVTKMHHGE